MSEKKIDKLLLMFSNKDLFLQFKNVTHICVCKKSDFQFFLEELLDDDDDDDDWFDVPFDADMSTTPVWA